jgi:hypothetical protein
MRSFALAAFFAAALPLAAFAQASPPPPPPASSTAPAQPSAGGITRDQFIEGAKERAGQRAAARFDQIDANHDGVIDQAERRAWRQQHARHARPPSGQPAPQ